jgi:hypothetical protein
MTDDVQPIERIEDIPPELRGLFVDAVKAARQVQDEQIKTLHAKLMDATRRGYDLAVRTLADQTLYTQWWESPHCNPDGPAREHYVRYLDDVAPGGKFWKADR